MEDVYALEVQTLIGPLFAFDSLLKIRIFPFLCLKHPRRQFKSCIKLFLLFREKKLIIERVKQ